MNRTIHRAYKTKLNPNETQCLQFQRHAGAARFAYNWGLERVKSAYSTGSRVPSAMDLHKELNGLKKTKLAWMYKVSKCAPQEALRDLGRAHDNFLGKRAGLAKRTRAKWRKLRKDGMPRGFPRFKSRKRSNASFRLTGCIHVFERDIMLPRIGRVRLMEKGYLPVDGTPSVHVLSATVSEMAGRWFVSLAVEQQIEVPENHGPVVGIDLGISSLIMVSDGTTIENPRVLSRYARKLRRLQRSASRKRPGSWKRTEVYRRIAKCHLRITNIRKDALHKATTWLARTKSAIGVESLNVAGMMGNHRLAGALADASMGEIVRQLGYKVQWYGSGGPPGPLLPLQPPMLSLPRNRARAAPLPAAVQVRSVRLRGGPGPQRFPEQRSR